MASDDSVATTALAIATIALLFAGGQFLQQIFGTADGYRRCQESVIGPWARFTRLSWRWKGFRFETKFTTPTIFYTALTESGKSDKYYGKQVSNVFLLRNGSVDQGEKQPLKALNESFTFQTDATDTVAWISLLQALELSERKIHSKVWAYHSSKALPSTSTGDIPGSLEPTRMFATVQLVESSWDLMPPDVVRPLAKTNVGSLITMSGRLGMRWITFAPERGVLSAQGNGHSISSTVITVLGILCEYRGDQSKYRDLFSHGTSSTLAASSESDMLRCGIIPPSMYSGRAIPLVGDGSDQIVMEKSLSKVGIDLDLRLQLLSMVDKPVLRETHDYLSLVLAESIGVMAPFMVMEGEEKCHVQWPSVRRWTYCITNCWEGRAALAYKLGSRLKQESNATLQRILNGLNCHEKMLPIHYSGWMDSISTWEDKDDGILNKFEMLNFLRGEHSWATASLHHLATPAVQGRPISIESHFMRYLSWHLNMSIRSLDKIEEAKRDYPFVSKGDKAKPSTVKHMLELGMRYVEAVDRDLTVTEAVQWWLMIYRSFCWYASVNIEYTYGPLPSSYFESRLPVYLG